MKFLLRGVGDSGDYWSAFPNSYYAYFLSFGNNGVYPSVYYDRTKGRSVRCVKE